MATAPPRSRSTSAPSPSVKVPLNSDAFLNELKAMFEGSLENGSVWVTLKRSSMKSKVQRNKMNSSGEPIEYKCLVRATNAKKTITTVLGVKDHLRFQASYATILKAHMSTLKKREKRDKRKAPEAADKKQDKKKQGGSKKAPNGSKA